MGLMIEADESTPYPYATTLTLTCDGDQHGLFGLTGTFQHAEGFMAEYRLAMNAGWKDTQGPQGRIFLCPACSGKIAV